MARWEILQPTNALIELTKIPGYPYNCEVDRPFLEELRNEFPSIDIIHEIRQWRLWLIENNDRITKFKGKPKKINYRARLRRWCKNAAEWKRKPKPKFESDYKNKQFKNGMLPLKHNNGKVTEVW